MSFQSYLDAAEAKTGLTPRRIVELARERGFDESTKAGPILEWLKEEYGLGRGHGMALVHVITKGPPDQRQARGQRRQPRRRERGPVAGRQGHRPEPLRRPVSGLRPSPRRPPAIDRRLGSSSAGFRPSTEHGAPSPQSPTHEGAP
jgi:hypothetical protein